MLPLPSHVTKKIDEYITKQKIFQTIYHKEASITSNNNNLKASLNIVKAGCTLFFENPLI